MLSKVCSSTVKKSCDRVSAAMTNPAFHFPMGRATITLASADVRKEGPSFDLHIAIGWLAGSGQMESSVLDMADVHRQEAVKRALEIGTPGDHDYGGLILASAESCV